jgi:dTDP-4-dehydrorhamnose reductase
MLGANLVLDALVAGYQVVAVDYEHPVRRAGVESVVADLSRPGTAQEVFVARRPDWVIHCAAATNVDACEADPATAFRLNRDMAGQVAMAAQAVGACLVHISTDAVFDGERGGYTEDDEPHPINVYGASKLEGEWAVLSEHPGALLVEMLGNAARGIYHVAGSECISKYEFGIRLAQVFGLDGRLIRRTSMERARLGARRGQRLCLDCSKTRAVLGRPLPDLLTGLQNFAELGRGGRAGVLRSLCPTSVKDGRQ